MIYIFYLRLGERVQNIEYKGSEKGESGKPDSVQDLHLGAIIPLGSVSPHSSSAYAYKPC